eukprot:GHVS01025465.1.p1 GENE.GHVS01025465.1~~GHVS01025465.1.p1  ORF type:complete len:399 (+),score=66.90 GHVS01025465.1:146-1342(+)
MEGKYEASESADSHVPHVPDYTIADWRHELLLPPKLASPKRKEFEEKLIQRIKEDNMTCYYKQLCETPGIGWTLDAELLSSMEKSNEEELQNLENKIADAKENYGDSEVREAHLKKAHFFCRICDKDKAMSELEGCYQKGVGSGSRLDSLLWIIRLGLFTADLPVVTKYIHQAKLELEKGGDWERRNKLKVYEAIQLMMCRDFTNAAQLITDSIATFMATEVLSFKSLIFYSIILAMLAQDRPTLREKIVECPEVLQVMEEDEELREFVKSFYGCQYYIFMKNLVPIARRVQRDRYLARHYRYFVRTIRLKAYSQFLEPYRSVTLNSMAETFGVSDDFMEEEVCSFISSGKLSCKIDKVAGVIESNRKDARNTLYYQTIKQGDVLLNRVQKLSRIIDM